MSQAYQQQLAEKSETLQALFADFQTPSLEIFDSPTEHYRLRAEFRVWHEEDDLYYIMFDQETRQKYKVEQFPAASELINELMPVLLEHLKPCESLRRKLFQVDFLSTLSGQVIVSLLYHRQLDELWQEHVKELKQKLNEQFPNIQFIGRARKQKILMDRDYVLEQLTVNGQQLEYMQIENSFTQPNGVVNQKMLEWAIDCTKDSTGDLLELYCGNGNFSLALAPNFNKVLATEIAKPSVHAAQHNIKVNQVDNLKILRMSAEDFTQAMNGEREFRRLQEAEVDLNNYECNTIFVDPPRAGLDDESVKMVQAFDNILYISCNPKTLKQNLEVLSQTHEIRRFALFDQFPYTHHMESGVLLSIKK